MWRQGLTTVSECRMQSTAPLTADISICSRLPAAITEKAARNAFICKLYMSTPMYMPIVVRQRKANFPAVRLPIPQQAVV